MNFFTFELSDAVVVGTAKTEDAYLAFSERYRKKRSVSLTTHEWLK